MQKRKQLLIDKKFQIGHTISVMRWTIIIIIIIIAVTGINVAYNSLTIENINMKNSSIISNLETVMQKQDVVMETVITWALNPAKMPDRQAGREVAVEHQGNISTIKNNISSIKNNINDQNNIVRYNYILLIIILAILITQSILLYYMLIKKTHRIAGTIHVMSNYMKEIIEGNRLPFFRNLRDKDEFKDFYELFKKTIEVMNKKQ